MPGALDAAIADYHGLLAADLTGAERELDRLVALQHERHVLFGDRIATRSLRPTFLTEGAYARLQDAVYTIRRSLLQIAAEAFLDDDALRNELGVRDWELELASIPTPSLHFSTLSRMDAFLTADGGFSFVEINGESPAGLGYSHVLAGIFQDLDVFRRFTERWPVRYVSPLEHTVQTLLRTYHEEFGGREERPTIAIVDHQDIPTVHEFTIIREYLERLGYRCHVVDPRALDVRDGWVYANGDRIDLLYRRLLTNEFWAIRDACGAFEAGYRAGKTCYLNTFRAKLVHKKAVFAFLTDPRYTHRLSAGAQEVLRAHVPWTRRFREGSTHYGETAVDLVAFVRANPERFVLKPNDEYGGKGVFLGFDGGDWDGAVSTALADGDYVVQEAVRIHREPFLMKADTGWETVPMVIDLDPYVCGPLVGGCLTRTSATNLANVTAGGGTLPLFVLRNTFADA